MKKPFLKFYSVLHNYKIAGYRAHTHTHVQVCNSSLWLHISKFMSVYTCDPSTKSKTIESLLWVTLCILSAWLDILEDQSPICGQQYFDGDYT